MKIPHTLTVWALLLFGISIGWGQAAQIKKSTASKAVITSRDGDSRVWQYTDYTVSQFGEVVTNTHSYTELCSGLNHLVGGKWVESKEDIEILSNGTAAATNGQHQAYFPGDIYQGQVELVTPDGKHLKSRPLGLSYTDGSNTVVIAELTNSAGYVVGNNQVIYPNAFAGLKVDLRYTYTKAGFEQDIVLRQQPPTPESFGLNPDTARLQVLTEFFSPPQPTVKATRLPTQAGLSLIDQNIGFGEMQMVPGRAFLLGQKARDAEALVSKSWLQVFGRHILLEEVPVNAIVDGLAALPLTAMNTVSNKNSHTASRELQLPTQRQAVNNTARSMMLARADYLNQGFVLDYQTINSSLTNYTFCGDTTYYISGTVNLYGTNVFEGGAVLKYTNNATISCQSSPQIFASTYRPVIFTAMDDNSVGDPITGSTGNPTNYYAGTALILPNNSNLSFQYLRISNAKSAIGVGGTLSLTNVQMVNCQNGVVVNFSQSLNLYMRNVLMGNVRTNVNLINLSGGATLSARNVTFANMPTAGDTNYALVGQGAVSSWSINLTNCILANVTFGFSIGSHLSGYYNGVYPSSAGFGNVITANYPFQNVGGGNYYLTNNSPFINVGSTNIESSLLLGLKKQTTYPPILITNVVISVNNTMSPQAQRDTDAPDLGYHYDPVDYLVNSFWITNATLTLTNGVAIATYNDQGMLVTDGANIKSVGTPLSPNWIVRYSSVQEQSIMLGSSPSGGFPLNPYHLTTAPDGLFRFTKFACPAGGGYHLYDGQPGSPGFSYNNLRVQDCELWNGANNFSGGSNSVAVLMNNLFARSTVTANVSASLPYTNNILAISNNLFWNVTVTLLSRSSSNSWYVFNNDFDGCTNKTTGIGGQQPTINGYNAYLNCNGQLYPTNIHDIVSASSLSYQVGPLGTFYQPTNSLLINMGSTTADLVGLYHYTVTTNMVSGMEIKETNSVVDIGYHYVAVNGASSPIDTDGDGIPDYLEDANGNGLVDGSENSWTNYNSGNGLVSPNGLIIFTPLK